MIRSALVLVLGGILASVFACRGGEPVLDSADLAAVAEDLQAIQMTPRDLSFKKDQVESELVLGKARRFLHEPLALPRYGNDLRSQLGSVGSLEAIARFPADQLEFTMPSPEILRNAPNDNRGIPADFLARLPPSLARAVQRIGRAAAIAEPLLRRALPRDPLSAFAAYALETFDLEHDRPELDGWDQLGIDTRPIRDLLRRSGDLELQDTELADAILSASDQLDRPAMFAAAGILARAVDETVADLATNRIDGEFEVATETPFGRIVCGGSGRNTYTNEAFLIIDTGGDDVYENSAGGANGLAGRPISIVIDLGGNDRFVSKRSFSQGSGVFGIGILAALGSNGVFEAKHLSQGAGFFGCGLLMTGPGRQTFQADTMCQGSGIFGAGILWQRGGDTTYRASEMAQGFGGTGGLGLLLDEYGNDSYDAGGKQPCSWVPGHYFSLAQGFGYGMRPFAGGGIGILADLQGHDHYVADVYGQGASYWYSVGLLLDAQGNDTYRATQYCQGAGIHLSAAALIDWLGDDTYAAHAICQGAAHDYSVGLLIDRAGNDRYTGDSTAQGAALYNSFALLLDRAGADSYTGTNPKETQATGHDGFRREYGSIGLLVDLGGRDCYSQGQTNDTCWIKPWYGAGLDMEVDRYSRFRSRTGERAAGDDACPPWRAASPSIGSVDFAGGRDSVEPLDHRVAGNYRITTQRLRGASPSIGSSPVGHALRMPSSQPAAVGAPALQPSARLLVIAPVDPHQPVERLLRCALRETDSPERRRAAAAASAELKSGARQALPYLLTRLDTPDVLVRSKIEELIDHLGTNSVPALTEGIRTAKNDEVARACCYFLARFGEPMVPAGSNPSRDATVRAVIRAVHPLLHREKTRTTALYTLGHYRAPQAFRPALVALEDPSEPVRLRAAQALGRIGDRRAIPRLAAALDDELWDVRYAAQDALVSLGRPSTSTLLRIARDGGSRARPHAVTALAKLGDPRAADLARELFRHEPPLIRAAMVRQIDQTLQEARTKPALTSPGG